MKKEVRIASFSSSLAHALTSIVDGVIDLDNYVTAISPQVYDYKCSKCGTEFDLTFKLYPNQIPLCKKCRHP